MVKYPSMVSAIHWKKRSSKATRRALGGKRRRKQRRGYSVAPEITFDIIVEILRRLPAKSLMRFRCVSKLWSGLIRSRYFCNAYLTKKISLSPPSMGEPVFLYKRYNFVTHFTHHGSVDFTTSQLLSLTLSSAIDSDESSLEPDLVFPSKEAKGVHGMMSLRGLILYNFRRKACIYNPTTRQSLTLPAVKSNICAQQELRRYKHLYFFGYDPVLDQYKIVCNVFERWITSEFWVFVLEPGGFWKRIEDDDQPHIPTGEVLCINGVIYYRVFNHTCFDAVYCFDVRSEKFRVVKTPPHAVSQFGQSVGFIEHGGKPALFDYTHIRETGVSELWILEDGLVGTWSRKTLVLKPCQKHLVGDIIMGSRVHGTGQNNEVILRLSRPSYLLYYHLIENDLREVNIIREKPNEYVKVVKVMDKCESIIHLET
ncbi:F-box protein [Raphanus sativus]|uniref:F-box protein At5g62660 n=1 Tax=Raphanus sativus TaxID=3726 RepID=A0A6J0MJZ7_RAPSA|nr:putative F-box protein At5g62660 [Raphanus sativus]KAJ4915829.1 F-box protein [Raphanus sativus]